jgi:hypothetical protein
MAAIAIDAIDRRQLPKVLRRVEPTRASFARKPSCLCGQLQRLLMRIKTVHHSGGAAVYVPSKEAVAKPWVLMLPFDLSSHGLFAFVLKKLRNHIHGELALCPQLYNTNSQADGRAKGG